MAWKDISASTFKVVYDDDYGSDLCGETYATLQYDDANTSATSAKLRFKYQKTTYYWYLDLIYILLYPTDSSKRKLLAIKTDHSESTAGWPYYSPAFTVTKAYNAEKFTIPPFWICNDGYNNTEDTAIAFYNMYKDGAWRGDNMRCTVAAKSISISASSTIISSVGKGTVSITDNGDNTFTLKGTKGASGTGNAATGPTLKWGYTSSCSGTFKNGETKALTIADESDATRTVYAKSITGATYGNDVTVSASLAVKQYVGPQKPGFILITYTKSKLTPDEDWGLAWEPAKAANSSSPVKGYRIRVFVNGKTIPIKNGSGTVIASDTGVSGDAWRYYYDREYTTTNTTFYATKNNLKAGDKVEFVIQGYTKNAKGTKIFGGSGTQTTSGELVIQNAGVVRTKVSGSWKEGQVYVKVSGAWKEAEAVYTKVNGVWKEAN
jgi:hypothetical protein